MAYLKFVYLICDIYWDYFTQKYEVFPQQTGIQYQGCVCPKCGSIGFLYGASKAATDVAQVPGLQASEIR